MNVVFFGVDVFENCKKQQSFSDLNAIGNIPVGGREIAKYPLELGYRPTLLFKERMALPSRETSPTF
jgi:hypothetical protein